MHDNKYKKITVNELKQLQELWNEGLSYRRIAERMQRSKNCILGVINRGGGMYGYSWEKAVESYKKSRGKGPYKIKGSHGSKTVTSSIEDRIVSLEMQMEIISETLNFIKDKFK